MRLVRQEEIARRRREARYHLLALMDARARGEKRPSVRESMEAIGEHMASIEGTCLPTKPGNA